MPKNNLRYPTVLFDWGDTVMRDYPERTNPMVEWETVEVVEGIAEVLAYLHSTGRRIVLATSAAKSDEEQDPRSLEARRTRHLLVPEKVLDEAREPYFLVADQVRKEQEAYSENYKKKHGVWPDTVPMSGSLLADYYQKSLRFQHLLASRQSELQFHDWLVRRVGELVAALTEAEAEKPYAALAAGMADPDFAYGIRCAELLARLKGAKAQALYESALAQEQAPVVLAELMRLRAKWGGAGAFDLLAKRLDDPAWHSLDGN